MPEFGDDRNKKDENKKKGFGPGSLKDKGARSTPKRKGGGPHPLNFDVSDDEIRNELRRSALGTPAPDPTRDALEKAFAAPQSTNNVISPQSQNVGMQAAQRWLPSKQRADGGMGDFMSDEMLLTEMLFGDVTPETSQDEIDFRYDLQNRFGEFNQGQKDARLAEQEAQAKKEFDAVMMMAQLTNTSPVSLLTDDQLIAQGLSPDQAATARAFATEQENVAAEEASQAADAARIEKYISDQEIEAAIRANAMPFDTDVQWARSRIPEFNPGAAVNGPIVQPEGHGVGGNIRFGSGDTRRQAPVAVNPDQEAIEWLDNADNRPVIEELERELFDSVGRGAGIVSIQNILEDYMSQGLISPRIAELHRIVAEEMLTDVNSAISGYLGQ